MNSDIIPVFIGYDPREDDAYRVCMRSIVRHSSMPVHIQPLRQEPLRRAGLYRRAPEVNSRIDTVDGKPFSTEFSFSRFLVPALMQWRDWAIFVDCDFLFREDIAKLWRQRKDKYAVQVVKHDYNPPEGIKMDGMKQEPYPRKNWSSLILWNCPRNRDLTVDAANLQTGSWLHGFSWLDDDEIGHIGRGWNWLEGEGYPEVPMAVHFTRGVPSMEGYEHVPYADEWRAYL